MNVISHNRSNYYGILDKVRELPSIGSPGTWGIGPFKLPDFGITEAFGSQKAGSGGGSMFQNQAIPYASPPSPNKSVQGATTKATSTNTASTPTNTTTSNKSSGGGGGGGGKSTLDKMLSGEIAWDDNLKAQLERDNQDTNALINEAYSSSAGYLDQAEGALRNDYPTILSEIEAQRAAAQRTAEGGKASTLGTIQEQETVAGQRNQNVMADARRLYDELRRGYQQRFGGASSAGQAASELSAVEQQRQMGRTQQDYGNTSRQIEQARTQVESKFQEQLMQLDQTKNQAVNEANRDFQSKLLQISQSRAENEQAKAQARLSALQDLRNKVYQINLQNTQFQQTLQAQKQQAELGLQTYAQQLGGYGEQAQTATNSFDPTVASSLQTNAAGAQAPINPYVGNMGKKDPREFSPEDYLKVNTGQAMVGGGIY